MSTSVNKLNKDTATLKVTVGEILTAAQGLDSKLLQLENTLNIPSKIDSDLKQLVTVMNTVKHLLQVAKLVPEISSEVSAIIKAINAIEVPLKKAQSAISDFDKKIKPLKKAVKKFEAKLKILINKIQTFQTKLKDYVTQVNNAQQCINSLPDGSTKTTLQPKLDKLADQSDQYVVKLNTLLQAVITKVKQMSDFIENKLDPLFKPLEDIENEITELENRLQGIIRPLSELSSLFNRKLSVSFPYSCPTWKDLGKTCHYSIGFTIKEILKGPGWIEDQIKRILSTVLYDVAKAFGLDKLIKKLVNEANGAMKKVLSTLKKLLKALNIQIPGLAKIGKTLSSILKALKNLESELSLDLGPIKDEIANIENDVAAFKKIYKNCKNVGH